MRSMLQKVEVLFLAFLFEVVDSAAVLGITESTDAGLPDPVGFDVIVDTFVICVMKMGKVFP